MNRLFIVALAASAPLACRDRDADRRAVERAHMELQRAGLQLQLAAQRTHVDHLPHHGPPRDDREARAELQRKIEEARAQQKGPVAPPPRPARSASSPCRVPSSDPLSDCP